MVHRDTLFFTGRLWSFWTAVDWGLKGVMAGGEMEARTDMNLYSSPAQPIWLEVIYRTGVNRGLSGRVGQNILRAQNN